MSRALLCHENSIGYVNCKIEWRMSPIVFNFETMSDDLKEFISYGKLGVIGDEIFSYVGWFQPSWINSLWILNFYGGVEFMVLLNDVKKENY